MLDSYEIEAEHPDQFVLHLLEVDAPSVVEAVAEQAVGLTHPPRTAHELLDALASRGLPKSAGALQELMPKDRPTAG